MIEKLILKNFKSYEKSQVKFRPGLNIFLGEVGAGKTSLLEAISFALFGRYAGSVMKNELIRRGTEKAEVSLFFSTSSGSYKVSRTIHLEKPQRARLWIYDEKEWKQAVEGAIAVSRSTEELMDVDSSTFLAAIYASQGEIKEMLESQPGKRRERLDKLLGIDTFEKIWGNLGDARNIVLTELTQTQEKAGGLEVLEKRMEDLKGKLLNLNEERKDLENFLEEIEARVKPAEQKLERLEDQKQKLAQLKTQIEGKNSEINNSSAILKALKEKIDKTVEAEKVFEKNKEFIQLEKNLEAERRRIETALQRKENLGILLQRDTDNLQQLEKRQTKLETQLENSRVLEEKLKTLKKKRETLPELKKHRAELDKKLEEVKAQETKILNEIENQNRKVKRIRELGECPTCLQMVPEKHKDKIEKEAIEDVNKLKDNYVFLEESRSQVQTGLENLEKEVELVQKADREYIAAFVQIKLLKDYTDEIEELRDKINEIQTRIRRNRQGIFDIKESPKTLGEVTRRLQDGSMKAYLAKEAEKQMAAKEDWQEAFLQEEEKLKALKTQLKEFESSKKELAKVFDSKEHEELKRSVRLLREDQAKTSEAIWRLKKAIEDHTFQTNYTEEQVKDKRKAQKRVEKLKKENLLLEILRRSLRDVVQPIIRKNSVLSVSEAFQGFYQELSNDNINLATLDEEGNVNVVRNGEPSPVTSLSGGETTCAALALRLAICSSLTRNQLLLLDEPTIHLDEMHRSKLRDFLGSHSFEQLIVVTHDNTFDSLPARIFKVERNRGVSVVSPLISGGT